MPSQLMRQIIIVSLCLVAALVAKSYVDKMAGGGDDSQQAALEGATHEAVPSGMAGETADQPAPTAGTLPEVSVEAP